MMKEEDYKLIPATEADGQEMLELIENDAAKGKLELFYTRRPNPYNSYMGESDRSEVHLVRDEEGKIAFQVGAVILDYHLEDEIKPIAYVGGLRKNPNFKGNFHWTTMLYKLDKEVHTYHDYYCSILNANNHAKKVLTKKRKYWPTFDEVCEYDTNIFNPVVFARKKWENKDYTLKKINKDNIKKVYEFIHQEGDKYNFFPDIKDLTKFKDLKIEDCYFMEDKKHNIVAFTALWNQGNYKQYIVKKYHFPLNVLQKLSFITERIGYIPFPKENETFPFYHLSFFLVKDNDIELYKTFLYKICVEEKKNKKSLVIGINNERIQKEIYNSVKKVNFRSTIYYIYFSKKRNLTKEPFIECALL